MRVVSDNSGEDLARNRAEHAIVWPLRELAANLMRIARGAGKPWEIGPQAASVVEVFEEYRKAVGCYPASDEIASAIRLERRHENHPWDEMQSAIETMTRGGLQIAASELLGQSTQESAGEDELFRGLQSAEQIREQNRRMVRSSKRPKPKR